MLDISHIKSTSKYRLLSANSFGTVQDFGLLTFSFNILEKGFEIATERKISAPQNSQLEKFTAVYQDLKTLKSFCAEGNLNGNSYDLKANLVRGKIKMEANFGQEHKSHSVKFPKQFVENNTFPYILPWLLNKELELNLPVFIPALAAFSETKINVYPHTENVDVPAGSFDCYRIKLETQGSINASQFLVFCRKNQRLIKGTTGNFIFELIY